MKLVSRAGDVFIVRTADKIGDGGEGEVFCVDTAADLTQDGRQWAVKLLHQPDSYRFTTDSEREESVQRLAHLEAKIADFPIGLPRQIVLPTYAVWKSAVDGLPVGYVMPYLNGCKSLSAYQHMVCGGKTVSVDELNQVLGVYKSLHGLLRSVHDNDVVVGDFNDENVMVDANMQPHLIDNDGMHFGKYFTPAVKHAFIDPLTFSHSNRKLLKRHDRMSDWYAFNVMLCHFLFGTHPYTGAHRPSDGQARVVTMAARIDRRLTIFSDEVVCKPSTVATRLVPDEVVAYLRRVFEQDHREMFPVHLLEAVRWSDCGQCGLRHARYHCPDCNSVPISPPLQVQTGVSSNSQVFSTGGMLRDVQVVSGQVKLAYYESGTFFRESRKAVMCGSARESAVVKPYGKGFIIADGPLAMAVDRDHQRTFGEADNTPQGFGFAGGGDAFLLIEDRELRLFWPSGGSKSLGLVPSQSRIWSGDKLGLVIGRTGRTSVCKIIDLATAEVVDVDDFPGLPPGLLSVACYMNSDYIWLLSANKLPFSAILRPGGIDLDRDHLAHCPPTAVTCHVMDRTGELVATGMFDESSDCLLASRIHDHCLSQDGYLTAITESGFRQYAVHGESIRLERMWVPDVLIDDESSMVWASDAEFVHRTINAVHQTKFTTNAKER